MTLLSPEERARRQAAAPPIEPIDFSRDPVYLLLRRLEGGDAEEPRPLSRSMIATLATVADALPPAALQAKDVPMTLMPHIQLRDGTPATLERDERDPSFRVVRTEAHGFEITADDEGYVSLRGADADPKAPPAHITVGPRGWAALKELVYSGVVDEALAKATGPQPPTEEAPEVLVEYIMRRLDGVTFSIADDGLFINAVRVDSYQRKRKVWFEGPDLWNLITFLDSPGVRELAEVNWLHHQQQAYLNAKAEYEKEEAARLAAQRPAQ